MDDVKPSARERILAEGMARAFEVRGSRALLESRNELGVVELVSESC
jgi:hypothetical protein